MNIFQQTDEQAEAGRKIRISDDSHLRDKIIGALGNSIDCAIEETRKEIKGASAFMLKHRNTEDEKIIMEMLVAEKKAARLEDKLLELIEKHDQLSQRVSQFVGLAGDYKMAESMLDKIKPLSNALVNAVNNGYQPAEQLNRFVSYEVQRHKDIQAKFERACNADNEMAKAAGL